MEHKTSEDDKNMNRSAIHQNNLKPMVQQHLAQNSTKNDSQMFCSIFCLPMHPSVSHQDS